MVYVFGMYSFSFFRQSKLFSQVKTNLCQAQF
jgi:hypothetical protein